MLENHGARDVFRRELDNLVVYVSKLKNRRSLVLNRLLLHCINNNVALPDLKDQFFYRQCMTVGLEGASTRKPFLALQEVWSEVFETTFPKIQFEKGSGAAINYASKELKTGVLNSL